MKNKNLLQICAAAVLFLFGGLRLFSMTGGVYCVDAWQTVTQYCWWVQGEGGSYGEGGETYINDEGQEVTPLPPFQVTEPHMECDEPEYHYYASYVASVWNLDPNCTYSVTFNGSTETVTGVSSWSATADIDLEWENEPDLYASLDECPPAGVYLISIAPKNGCSWIAQGTSISKSDFNIQTDPSGMGDDPRIVLTSSIINSTDLSPGTPGDLGGIGTFIVNAYGDDSTGASYTFNVVDTSRSATVSLLKLDQNKMINLWNEAASVASNVGWAFPAPNVTGQITGVKKNQLCGCEVKQTWQGAQGTMTASLAQVTLTSPEFPIWGAVTARFQGKFEGNAQVSVSAMDTDCTEENICANVTGQLKLSLTGAVCALNCSLVSVSATAQATIGVSGQFCSETGVQYNGTRTALVAIGTVTLANFDVASYSYPIWSN